MKRFLIISSIAVLLCLCGCSSHVSKTIDEAFVTLNEGNPIEGRELINGLLAENNEDISVYDKANLGLAAMVFGVECEDLELGSKGYNIASAALKQDRKECDRMIEDEKYFDGESDTYANAIKSLYSNLVDIQLSQQVVDNWQKTYYEYILGGNQNFRETLSLNPDKTFVDKNLIKINCREGKYDVKSEVETSVSGKWNIEDGIITMKYNASTLNVSIVPNTFKIYLSNSAFFSGGDIFGDLFLDTMRGVDDEVRNSLKSGIYHMFDEMYRDAEPSYMISIEDGDLVLRTHSSTQTYTRVD